MKDRGLVVLKTSMVDAEFDKLHLNLGAQRSTSRMVSMTAYEAGGAAGASLAEPKAILSLAGSKSVAILSLVKTIILTLRAAKDIDAPSTGRS